MSLNPLIIAHLGIARRPIVAALLGIWPDEIAPPLPVYAVALATGGEPVRPRFILPLRILRARITGRGSSRASASFVREVGSNVAGTGRFSASVAAGVEVARQLIGRGSSVAAASWRRVTEPAFSDDDLAMMGVFALRCR